MADSCASAFTAGILRKGYALKATEEALTAKAEGSVAKEGTALARIMAAILTALSA